MNKFKYIIMLLIFLAMPFNTFAVGNLTEDEISLIAVVTMAESNDEPELGRRLVIDTILNRCDSDKFPNTISEVIYQKGQFACISDGRVKGFSPTDEIKNLIKEEIENRKNTEVVFFRTKRYSKWGTALFKVGRHFFSKIK